MTPNTEQKVTHIKKYTITVNVLQNGKFTVIRECEGFNSLELLGIIERCRQDIIKQISGEMPPPEMVTRKVINPKKIKL